VIFSAQLVAKVLDGTKTMTRRRIAVGRPLRYQAGKTYAVQPGRGKPHVGHVRVWEVRAEPLWTVTLFDAQAEGFPNPSYFIAEWKRLHGAYDSEETVAVIRFMLAGRCPECREVQE
jgi:hypothetical protein